DQPAPVPRAASFREHAGTGRRRPARTARRSLARPSRRAVSRRIAGIPAASTGLAAPAARNRRGIDCARQSSRHLSGALHAGRGNESLPLRQSHEPGFTCRRGPNTRCAADYQTRISGPLLDRIDLQIEVPAVTAADLILPPPAEGSREIAERVAL